MVTLYRLNISPSPPLEVAVWLQRGECWNIISLWRTRVILCREKIELHSTEDWEPVMGGLESWQTFTVIAGQARTGDRRETKILLHALSCPLLVNVFRFYQYSEHSHNLFTSALMTSLKQIKLCRMSSGICRIVGIPADSRANWRVLDWWFDVEKWCEEQMLYIWSDLTSPDVDVMD